MTEDGTDDIGEETQLTCILCGKKFMGAVLFCEQQVCDNCDPADVHDLMGYMGDAL